MSRAIVLLFAVFQGSAAAAQDMGRLFFSPEQRAALDARRKARVPDKPDAAPVIAAPVTRLDGYVRSSGGRATVWVNGAPDDPLANERIVPDREGRLPLSAGGSGPRVRLKPGETLDRSTGEIVDLVGEGRIGVQRNAKP